MCVQLNWRLITVKGGVGLDTPKYLTVQDWIKNEITKGTYVDGDRIPSENELMEMFGFSRQTIRLAISNLENMGYLERIKGSGTYVNVRAIRNEKEGHSIGVILRHLDYYIYPEIINGIEYTLMRNGYTMTLGITHNDVDKELTVLRSMLEKAPDGIIAEPCRTAMPMQARELYTRLAKQTPLLFINSNYVDCDIPLVAMDYADAAGMAVRYLIDKGHKNIGAIFRSDETDGHRRYEGFNRALTAGKLQTSASNVMWYTSDTSNELFSALVKQSYYSGMSRCSAIVCHDDKTAEQLVACCKELNVKPFEDVSIISFDNSHTAEMLGLTSLEHNKEELGEKAAEVLLRQIRSREKESVLIKSKVVERYSVHKRGFFSSWDTNVDLFDTTD
jgi:GntR family transcriptional regulator of arabinose operon